MECGQHTTQSQQPVSEKILNDICASLCFRTRLILNAAPPPREREGFSETDSIQYCNSKKHQNQEEAQLLTTPPMHQIQPHRSIKRLFKKSRCEHKAQAEDKQTRKIKKDEARRNTEAKRKPHYSKSVTLYFTFMNIVLEIQTKSQLSQNSKLKMHLK